MLSSILQWLRFPEPKNDKERYDQLVVRESLRVFWELNWFRQKQFGIGGVKFMLALCFFAFVIAKWMSTGVFEFPDVPQLAMGLFLCVITFLFAWPLTAILAIATYYLKLPFLLLNPLGWFALHYYGYSIGDDVQFFRRSVLIRAQDELLRSHGIEPNLRD